MNQESATALAYAECQICRQLVLAHGGQIWAESVVGQGSSFHVRLPLAGSETIDRHRTTERNEQRQWHDLAM